MDADEFLAQINEPLVERGALPSGINPWGRVVAPDLSRFEQTRLEHGTIINCEECGKEKLVHPSHVKRTFFCDYMCRDRNFAKRRKGLTDREPLNIYPLWEWRERNASQ